MPRVMQDGQLEVRDGQSVPVLVQRSSHRLIVLNSTALGHMHIGQTLVLHVPNEEPVAITLEAIDWLALTARYAEYVVPV